MRHFLLHTPFVQHNPYTARLLRYILRSICVTLTLNRVARSPIVIHKLIRTVITIAILTMIASCDERDTPIEIRGAIALSEHRLIDGGCSAIDRDIKTNATITIRGDRGDIVGSALLEPGYFDWVTGQCVYRFMAIVPDQRSYTFDLPNGWSVEGSAIGVNRIGF